MIDSSFLYLPAAGGHVLVPNKLVRKSERTKVDLPNPDSPKEYTEMHRSILKQTGNIQECHS